MHKLCPTAGCETVVCRAFFPDKQTILSEKEQEKCRSGDYKEVCSVYAEGLKHREERRRKELDMRCPFASNKECGHPDRWQCKGGNPAFRLYPCYSDDGELLNTWENILETCLSGDRSIYVECPHFKTGLEQYGKTVEDVFNPRKL